MDIVICRCGQRPAVRAPRSSVLCRPCYVNALGAGDPALTVPLGQVPLVEALVVGPMPVTDAITTNGVPTGGTVWLDPVETNVVALIYAGHVELAPAGAGQDD